MTDPDTKLRIRQLPVWRGTITVEPLPGGLSNHNFRVRNRKSVV